MGIYSKKKKDRRNMTDIKSLTLEELKTEMEGLGEKSFRAAQLYQWMHQ